MAEPPPQRRASSSPARPHSVSRLQHRGALPPGPLIQEVTPPPLVSQALMPSSCPHPAGNRVPRAQLWCTGQSTTHLPSASIQSPLDSQLLPALPPRDASSSVHSSCWMGSFTFVPFSCSLFVWFLHLRCHGLDFTF